MNARLRRNQFVRPATQPEARMASPVPPSAPSPVPDPKPWPVPQVDRFWLAEVNSPLRRVAFGIAIAFIFIRFSFAHELLAERFNLNLRLALVFGSLSIVGLLVGGGVVRSFRHSTAKYWTGFLLLCLLATAFSQYISGSLDVVTTFAKSELLPFFLVAGLVVTLQEYYILMKTLVAALMFNVVSGFMFSALIKGDRMALEYSTISNPNDFAAHILLLIPFLLFFILIPGSFAALKRIFYVGVFVLALYLVAATGSRAALIAIVVGVTFSFLRMSGARKVVMIVLVGASIGVGVFALPQSVLERYTVFFQNDSSEDLGEAVGSAEARTDLAKQAIILTLHNPIFGVGPGMYADAENSESKDRGMQRGHWQVAHNSYLEISSEIGIPALIVYLCAIFSAFFCLNRVFQKARRSTAHQVIANAAFCTLLALVMCGTSLFFLTLGLRYYFPTLTGMAVALAMAAQREISPSRSMTTS